MMEPLWKRQNMFVCCKRGHWHQGMTALLRRKTSLSINLFLYLSICVRYDTTTTTKNKKHGSSLRCRLCPKPAPPAYYCCSVCSNADGCKPFAVCGPKSGWNCGNVHAITAPLLSAANVTWATWHIIFSYLFIMTLKFGELDLYYLTIIRNCIMFIK